MAEREVRSPIEVVTAARRGNPIERANRNAKAILAESGGKLVMLPTRGKNNAWIRPRSI